jgi:hypothetical protein
MRAPLLQIAAHIAAPRPAGSVGEHLAEDWWKVTAALQQMAAAPGDEHVPHRRLSRSGFPPCALQG